MKAFTDLPFLLFLWIEGGYCWRTSLGTGKNSRLAVSDGCRSKQIRWLSSTDSTTGGPSHPELPSPPWTFQVNKIYYQFRWIRVDKAQRCCPGMEDMFLISIGSYTLGGVFCVEYETTPIGPYREVAFLSALVARRSGIGAWASHVVVNSDDAARCGQEYWGLPAIVLPIEFEPSTDGGPSIGVTMDDQRIVVNGWNSYEEKESAMSPEALWKGLDISLPSFSGRLPIRSDNRTVLSSIRSPLLRYSLRIKSPLSISVADNSGEIAVSGHEAFQKELQDLLASSFPALSLEIDKVCIIAGEPNVESS